MVAKHFRCKDAARAFLESRRWPDGVICPRCEEPGEAASYRPGRFKCRACQRDFSVRIGTIFESSRLPLDKWLLAIQLFCTKPDGVKVVDLQQILRISYASAWTIRQRIVQASKQLPVT